MEKLEQSRLNLSKSINDLILEKLYWQKRCLFAEDYIEKSNIDFDINIEQSISYEYWQNEVKKNYEIFIK